MARCEVCGNDYDMAFEVHAQGAVHTFDSFDPGSAAERCSWTRRSASPQVTGLRASRNAANPWTHVRTVFEPTTSRDADEARTRPQRPAITTAVSQTCPSGC